MSAKLIQVIEVQAPRGAGTTEDPVRTVRQFWSTDGKLLAEDDPEKQVAMSRSQASALMKNLDLQRERALAAGRFIKARSLTGPKAFKDEVLRMGEHLFADSTWRP